MKQLSIVSALFNQQEVTNDPTVLAPWPTAYIVDEHGHIFTHRKLGGGGQVTLKTKTRPDRLKDLEATFSESIDHLPGGKIPLALFSSICSFFKKVMKDKGYDKSSNMSATTGWRASNEAMAHILWNKDTLQYEIGIPTQKVSTAAVNFAYDDVKENHIIIVDVHSHNNMGAFWSQRDDKEDEKGIWFSGVVGTIDKGPTTNWRFSMNGEFRSIPFDSIFDGAFDTVSFEEEVPEEWMDKVSQYVSTYASSYPSHGNQSWHQRQGSHVTHGSGYQGSGQGYYDWYSGFSEDDFEKKWFQGGPGNVSKPLSNTYHNLTFAQMRDEMTYHLIDMSLLGQASMTNNLYRPRITTVSKQELGQALFTVLECFSDEDIEVAFSAIAKSLSNHRRSKATRHKTRKFLRTLDGVLSKDKDPVQPSHIAQ